MCGIACIFNIKQQTPELRQKALTMAKRIRHRGPDWSGIYCGGSAILAHERLSIVDPQSGRQPLFSPDRKQILAVNGEIYNHRDIRSDFAGQYEFQTGSDCEVILALYRRYGINFIERLSGIFAFALYDEERDEYLAKLSLNNTKYEIARMKGLGEMDADELNETTMDINTRVLRQITIEDAVAADEVFSQLMGEEVAPRREFIEENATYARLDV